MDPQSKSSSPRRMLFFLYGILIFLSSNNATLSSAQTSSNSSEADRQALLCFKSGISSDPGGVLQTWRNDSLNFCSWRGVNCSTALPIRVLSLELSSAKLKGELQSCMVALTSLALMDLSNNDLSGSIPEEIGKLSGLQSLMLAGNNLTGNIPVSLGTAASLRYVNLAMNNLYGEIPGTLFNNSSNLVTVDFRYNFLSGVIPRFQKTIPLQFLGLSGNSLSGSIPASLGNVSSLNTILLAENSLKGSIPKTLGHILNLSILDLGYNKLSGNVPGVIYNISSLIYLGLSNNMLDGQILFSTGHSLPNLESLVLSGNIFSGMVPASLTNMSKLQVIDLSINSLSGSIPSLGSLSNLSRLVLGRNMLQAEDWAFLTSLTNCSKLLMLALDGNSLNGSLPKSVGNLSTNLERLNFRGNRISGTIPASIGNLMNLTLLNMEQNMLSETIPLTIGNLKNLNVLSFSTNRLTGEIPSTIGDLPQLNQLSLDDNLLSGNIPASLGHCKRLAMLNLSVNNLDGSIPSEILSISSLSLGLDLSNNHLTGTIPPEIGKLINLVLLNVSSNKLYGEIPPELGLCVVLSSLQMEGNMLSGIIPQSLSKLKAIQLMDLSENNLSGQIPEFFGIFSFLYHLNLSYNKLEGPIPTSGIFTNNSNAIMLEGNLALCQRIPIFPLPICPTTSVTKRKINAHLLLIIAPPVTIALLSILCVVVTVMKGKTIQPSESYRETMKKVSYGDILKATNWFSPVNKISSSYTASVYIGRFEFDTDLVAIKVFHIDEQVDFDNNEFKALVYEFMANGSLDMWVHPRQHQGIPRRVLSLGQRISIVAEVASALDYLHNQLIPPLIHCDLKPSNVLLDYDMTSRIGDFGSAKFLSSSLSSNPEGLVGALGTIGYIAPEYAMGCKISTGGDVYGFGVLLLEMLTAKRPTDKLFGSELSLHKYVDLAFPDKINEILDPQIQNKEDEGLCNLHMQNCIIPLIKIGLMCSMESPKDRPGMKDVCAKLVAIQEAFVQTF
ncbi:unnamed protein product [Urochloa decumbens]|uniref:non-specific serine/threonine protein kinase n=1 Tax=Urochloa decumbens TaxID=240449 RepID=A0ABC9G8H7_9POAL